MQLWLIDTCVAAETAESNNDFVYPDEITKSIILYYRMFNSRSIYIFDSRIEIKLCTEKEQRSKYTDNVKNKRSQCQITYLELIKLRSSSVPTCKCQE